MKNIIRRSIKAALALIVDLSKTVRATLDNLLSDLFRMIDAGRFLIIEYTKKDGTESRRAISPLRFVLSDAGNISVRAFDHRDQDEANFRVDGITSYQWGR